MDFRFNSDILELRDRTRAFLENENTVERLRTLPKGGDTLALWPKLAEIGLLGAVISEEKGGLGLGVDDCLLLVEEAGRTCLPEPFSETALLLIPLLEQLDEIGSIKLSDVLSGKTRGAIVHPLNPFTNHIEGADFALVFDNQTLRIQNADEINNISQTSIDPGRKISSVVDRNGQILADGIVATRMQKDIEAKGACAVAAELCGLADRMISLATEYSKTREQFGQPIGAFQAVKHLLANAKTKLEFARPVVFRAGAAIEKDSATSEIAVSHAKLAAYDAALLAAENAIQVFGGMGYTFEVDLHFFMKRIWALNGLWGDRNYHLARIDKAIFENNITLNLGESF